MVRRRPREAQCFPAPAASAIKTGDGRDYYDVIVLGGGTAGAWCRQLAELGINPKTGDAFVSP